jgi:predicted dehydrogenase
MTNEPSNASSVSRRHFLAAAGASALTFAILPTRTALGTEANTKLNLGLIGCGGRGQWITDHFINHGGFNFVAVADYFADRADAVGEALKVPADRRFTGLNAYKRLLEQKLDAVVIESPPYFHPEQGKAAVEAGKHVYMAKPIAVDVPGCQTVEASAKQATDKKLAFVIDFQTRTIPLLKDIWQRVQEGQIGRIVSAEANYQTGPVGEGVDNERRKDPKNQELRLRAWVTDRALSGDIITEQNIHAIDMACWYLNAGPISAYGSGGKCRNFVGDCWDHFSVIYKFPKDVLLTFSSKQVGFGYDDILCRLYGDTGCADTHYFGTSRLKGREEATDGKLPDVYAVGAQNNIATFHESIVKGDFSNPTAVPSVRSNLATILGRQAAYKNTLVTWDEMIRNAEPLTADLSGLKS